MDVSSGADGATVVTLTRTIPAAVPDFAKRFVGETIQIVQEETWTPAPESGPYDATLSMRVVGQPATFNGTVRIEDSPDGAVEMVQGDVKVSMPFIGGKFEAELAQGVIAAARVEERMGREWLSSQAG